ncbi:MAG: hypothetical protein NC453_18075 [Muribaculum sp.]|nr:hypothetical protein [Muribaculum sp.]
MKDIAICVIGYNRLDSISRLLNSLSNGKYHRERRITLYISIDKSESDEVLNFAKSYCWTNGEKIVIEHDKNLGLRKHILSCGSLLNHHDALIVLEDDIVVAESFYMYATQTVTEYFDNPEIAGISLYNFPLNYHNSYPFIPLKSDSDVYMMQNAQSWGQIWMKKQWREFMNWYNLHSEEFSQMSHLPKSICSWPKSSWLKYHTRYCIEEGKYFIYPYTSMSTCFSDCGVHVDKNNTYYQAPLVIGQISKLRLEPTIKYDSFFECENIYTWLKLNPTELCIDFYGDKNNALNKRYWLTRKALPYSVLKSFALSLKPYPINIFMDISGVELFLYDTSVPDTKPNVDKNTLSINFDKYMFLHRFDLKASVYHFIKKLFQPIHK